MTPEEKESHIAARARIAQMTPEEQKQTLIDSGIITSDGNLAPQYRPAPTRRDLLLILEQLQDYFSQGLEWIDNDRDQQALPNIRRALEKGFQLCLDARGHDPIVKNRGPWAKPTE